MLTDVQYTNYSVVVDARGDHLTGKLGNVVRDFHGRRRFRIDLGPLQGWWRSVVVSGVDLINEVNRHWARLVLGWVAAAGG